MKRSASLDELEQSATHLYGPKERRLFLMDDEGTYWVRSDMTSEEADAVADSLLSWLYHAMKGVPLGTYAAARLYDDGVLMPR